MSSKEKIYKRRIIAMIAVCLFPLVFSLFINYFPNDQLVSIPAPSEINEIQRGMEEEIPHNVSQCLHLICYDKNPHVNNDYHQFNELQYQNYSSQWCAEVVAPPPEFV